MRTFAHFCGLLAATTLLAACGTKGPLVKPAPDANPGPAAVQADHSSAPGAAR